MASEPSSAMPAARPKAARSLIGKAIIVMVALGISGGIYYLVVHSPMSDSKAALRTARYDLAMSALSNIPARFNDWPGVPLQRSKAVIGARAYRETPEWESIAEDLRGLRAEHPSDDDLMLLEARSLLRTKDFRNAAPLLASVVKSDPRYPEAWFLSGMLSEFSGEMARAVEHYRTAAGLAADAPNYRSALARALLETGKTDEALAEFQKVRDYPLARLDQAAAHWSKGEMKQAAAAQREAVAMLENTGTASAYVNRREWLYRDPSGNDVARLSTPDEKRCYARVGEAVSRTLAGESGVAFPPAGCQSLSEDLRELVADRLCRFVDKPKPEMSDRAGRLRRALGMNERCPG